MNKKERKEWLLAGVFTVTLWTSLAALFYFLNDLMAGLFIITVLLIMMMLSTCFIQNNNQENNIGKSEDIQK